MQLRRNQIEAEAEALQAVEAVLAGGRVEDGRIECKADWPDENKARQLAGHANTARGEPIIWLIGVDERNHKLTRLGDSASITREGMSVSSSQVAKVWRKSYAPCRSTASSTGLRPAGSTDPPQCRGTYGTGPRPRVA